MLIDPTGLVTGRRQIERFPLIVGTGAEQDLSVKRDNEPLRRYFEITIAFGIDRMNRIKRIRDWVGGHDSHADGIHANDFVRPERGQKPNVIVRSQECGRSYT